MIDIESFILLFQILAHIVFSILIFCFSILTCIDMFSLFVSRLNDDFISLRAVRTHKTDDLVTYFVSTLYKGAVLLLGYTGFLAIISDFSFGQLSESVEVVVWLAVVISTSAYLMVRHQTLFKLEGIPRV